MGALWGTTSTNQKFEGRVGLSKDRKRTFIRPITPHLLSLSPRCPSLAIMVDIHSLQKVWPQAGSIKGLRSSSLKPSMHTVQEMPPSSAPLVVMVAGAGGGSGCG